MEMGCAAIELADRCSRVFLEGWQAWIALGDRGFAEW